MSETKLNWESAAVRDGKLSVDLEGELSKDWKHSFDDTVKMLANGQWGEVRLKKQTIHVSEIAPGEEDKLRFFLESVVEQANTSARAHHEQAEQESHGGADDTAEEASGPDAEMTERFRSFSTGDSGDGAESADSD